MADYQSLLTRAVANLPASSPPTARQAIYDRARKALVTQLRSPNAVAGERHRARGDGARQGDRGGRGEVHASQGSCRASARLANARLRCRIRAAMGGPQPAPAPRASEFPRREARLAVPSAPIAPPHGAASSSRPTRPASRRSRSASPPRPRPLGPSAPAASVPRPGRAAGFFRRGLLSPPRIPTGGSAGSLRRSRFRRPTPGPTTRRPWSPRRRTRKRGHRKVSTTSCRATTPSAPRATDAPPVVASRAGDGDEAIPALEHTRSPDDRAHVGRPEAGENSAVAPSAPEEKRRSWPLALGRARGRSRGSCFRSRSSRS